MDEPQHREDRVALVRSLGLPLDAPAPERFTNDGGAVTAAMLAGLVDDEVAARTWRHWVPARAAEVDDPAFRDALRAWFAAGVGMGYALDRFRDAAERLPECSPEDREEAWADILEEAVAATNRMELKVFVSPSAYPAINQVHVPGREDESWDGLGRLFCEGIFYDLGVVLPQPLLMTDDALSESELRIEVNDARLPRRALLPLGLLLVNDTPAALAARGIRGALASANPADGRAWAVVPSADARRCDDASLTTWASAGHAILTLTGTVRGIAGAFVNSLLTERYLDQLQRAFPTVVDEARRALSTLALTRVLRALVDEEVSIRNLELILEVVALPESIVEVDDLRMIAFAPAAVEQLQVHSPAPPFERRIMRVRASMRRYLSHKYTRGQSSLLVYLLDVELESWLAQRATPSPAGRDRLVEAIREELHNTDPAAVPAILTTSSVRRRLRQIIAADLPQLPVVSYQELSPEMNIQPLARIGVPTLSDDEAVPQRTSGAGA